MTKLDTVTANLMHDFEKKVSPLEYIGALRFLIEGCLDFRLKHSFEARFKDAVAYATELAEFAERVGKDAIYPPRLFWTDANPSANSDIEDVLVDVGHFQPVQVFSNQEPYYEWYVRLPASDENTPSTWRKFDGSLYATRFARKQEAEFNEATLKSGSKPEGITVPATFQFSVTGESEEAVMETVQKMLDAYLNKRGSFLDIRYGGKLPILNLEKRF